MMLKVLWIEMKRFLQLFLFSCWLDMTHFGMREGSFLIGVIRICFALLFGDEFILGIGGWICNLGDFFSQDILFYLEI